MTKKTSRRRFLKLAAASAGLAAAPTLWIPKAARGASAAFGAADHLLILFAKGGLRSHALFNAVGTPQHNPWGSQSSASQWSLGAACGNASIESSALGSLPGIASIASDIAVLACVDHDPMGVPEVDHDTASFRIAGGESGGAPSLLARIGRDHPRYVNGFSLAAVPPVEIVPSEFGHGAGDYASARPIQVRSPYETFGGQANAGVAWRADARRTLAQRFAASRPGPYQRRVNGFVDAKRMVELFAPMLVDPLLNVFATDATDGQNAITNAELREIFGGDSTADYGDPEPRPTWSAAVTQALRFFHFGAPAVVVTNDIYDLHGAEDQGFGPRATDLVRQLVGLNHVLKALTHPTGGTYWDKTVVAVVSEFSRNNTDAQTGFNSGRGSDHTLEAPDPMRNQAIAVMGGPIAAGGQLIGATDSEMRALDKVFSSRRLISTFLDLVGVNHEAYWPDAPITELTS